MNRSRFGKAINVFYKTYGAFKIFEVICNKFYQILSGLFNSPNPVLVYIKPQRSTEALKNCFDITRLSRGCAVIRWYLNTRITHRDTLNTPKGTCLQNVAMKTKFKVLVPFSPNFVLHRISSVADLFRARELTRSMPQNVEGSWLSDHSPVISLFPLTTTVPLVNMLPQNLFFCHRIQQDSSRSNRNHLQSAILQLRDAESPEPLEGATMKLLTCNLCP